MDDGVYNDSKFDGDLDGVGRMFERRHQISAQT